MLFTYRFILFSILSTSIFFVSCREKTKEENMKSGDKRFYNTEWHISAFSIDGKDMMDSVRKYKMNGRFKFTCSFRNLNEVDGRNINSEKIPLIGNAIFPFDTLPNCELNGWWNLQPNSYKFQRMILSVYLTCYESKTTDNQSIATIQSALFQNPDYWNVIADDGHEISLSLEKEGKSYFKKITAN